MSEAPMLIVGLMSGTSLDGMDAALVRISGLDSISLVAFAHRPYAASERAEIEAVLATGGTQATARLHAALGDWASEAVDMVLSKAHIRADHLAAIAFSGQTIWHEPPLVTWQLGDAARLAERFAVRVVHDLRSRDVAAGGQGAPLVPLVDALCFSATASPRVLLNIGGMSNATWLPPRGTSEQVIAADAGPGMAIVDALARWQNPALPYDVDGRMALNGKVDEALLAQLLSDPFFKQPPPRSTGREHFGVDYARKIFENLPGNDGVATAVALTVDAIADFCRDFLPPAPEVVISGGGAHHPMVFSRLQSALSRRNVTLQRFDDLYFDGDAKEAVAFGLLGWLTLHGQPGNLPQVTGAAGLRVLGSVIPA